ncbi:MAG: hypothetical protein ACOYIK_04505 [Coriobacteriales bacterium]|jgi:hypothetical protein
MTSRAHPGFQPEPSSGDSAFDGGGSASAGRFGRSDMKGAASGGPASSEQGNSEFRPIEFCGGRIALIDERVRDGAMDFKFRFDAGVRMASPGLLRWAFEQRPTLREHACTDDLDPNPTTLAHLLEHLAIDLLVELHRSRGEETCFAGYSAWLDKSRGLARITLTSLDPSETESGVIRACEIVEDYLASKR